MAYDIAHELGHVIDVTFNTANTRKEWMKLRGINPETPWFTNAQLSDLSKFFPKDFVAKVAAISSR